VPQREGLGLLACVRPKRGPMGRHRGCSGGSAGASKDTSVCLVVDSPNPVSLITLNEVTS